VALAAALAMAAAGCGSGTADKAGGAVSRPVVLTLVDGQPDISNAQPFAAAVSRLSRGSLVIRIEGDWRFTDPNFETKLIKYVQAEKAPLGITASRAFDTVGIDSFQALQAPFLIDSYPLERKVLDSAIPDTMLQGLRPHGLVGLAVLPGPLRRPFSFAKPLLAVSSYRGARIGILPSQVTAGIFRALGAVPVAQRRSNFGQVITGLTGVEEDASVIDSGFAVPGAVLTGNVVVEPRPNVIFMNRRAFDSLTATQRNVLSRAGVQARSAGIYRGNDTASVADLCRRGIQVVSASPADLAALRAAVQPVYQRLESNPETKAFINQITSMRRAVGGSPDSVICPTAGTAARSGGTATLLQGTWQVTITEAQLVAAGAGAGELQPSEGNWGHLTLKFSRGQWWLIGPPDTIGSASGTYVLTGSRIRFYRHDHTYNGSDTEVWGPYIWSVYRDTLTFKKTALAGDFQGPTNLVVKPWGKIGA
jgi:TRAP-type C4-dicarboxylate transport system substrate-binding protein